MSEPHISHVALPDLPSVSAFGKRVANALQAGDVIALSGALGAGKTTLARAILAGLGYQGEVPSPTFTILETYAPPAVRLPVVHADFYRLNKPCEAEELGLSDYREDAVLLAEWPDKAGGFAAENGYLGIDIAIRDGGRAAWINRGTSWREREF
jgi:tRNA threonylcarbamoyladenosine biosynthesis protein TsaE